MQQELSRGGCGTDVKYLILLWKLALLRKACLLAAMDTAKGIHLLPTWETEQLRSCIVSESTSHQMLTSNQVIALYRIWTKD